jgi:autotransporter translocation and assembly factor TamB
MIKKILLALLVCFFFVVCVINTTWFKDRLFELVTNRIEHATGMHVTVGGFQYTFPLKFTIQNIALGSPEDPDLTIAEVYLHASVSALWRNEIKIHNLRIDNVIVHRAIQLPESSEQRSGPIEFAIPVNISHFSVNDLTLDPRLPPLSITGNFEGTGPSAVGFVHAQLAQLSIAFDVNYQQSNGLIITIQEGRTGPLTFGGQLILSPDLMLDRTQFHVQLANIKFLERWVPLEMHGRLAAICQIEGPLLRPKASVDITSKRLFLLGYAWENFKTSLNCHFEKPSLSGSVNLSSSGTGYSITSLADFEWRFGELFKLPSLILEGPRTKIKGSFLADLMTGGIESTIEGTTDDLTLLQEIIDDTASGKIAFTSNFTMASDGGQIMDLSIKGENVQIGTLEAAKGEIEIHGTDIHTNPHAEIKIHLANFLWNSLRLDEVIGETIIDNLNEQWPFQISGSSQHLASQFMARGSWLKEAETTWIALDEFKGKLLDEQTFLKEPVTVRLSPEVVNISPLAFQFGQARLFATVDLSRHHFGSTIDIEEFPLAAIRKIDPSLPLNGQMNATFILRGDPAQPEGKIEVTVQDLKIAENIFAKLPVLHGALKAELKDNLLSWSGDLEGLEEQPIHLEARLPLHASFYPFSIKLDSEEELAAQIRVKGDVIPLLQLFFNETSTLRGETDIAIDITGSYAKPEVTGKAFLHNGTFESVKTGAIFKDIQAVFEAKGNEIQLTELTASDRFDGKLTATGIFQLDPSQSFPYHFDFVIDKSRFFNLDFADAVFTGNARFAGTTHEGQLSGSLKADRLAIVIPEQLPSAAHSVEVTFVNTPKGQKTPTFSGKGKKEWPIKLDLAVAVPKNTSISGTNLKTTWKGNVNIQGTAENAELHGELKIDKGSYLFNGKEFLINQGTISFAGDPEKKTSLYVIASHDLGKIIAEIILRGPIKNPTISFRSNPPLSQREILAWILFGRGVSDITATEGAQLNQSITNLKTGSNGPDMLTKIRNKMGIDRIDINRGDNEDSNQVSVQVGKYISQGVYVSVNKSVTAESNQVCLEANLTREIKVQAEVGDDQEGQLLLKWKKDY